MSFKRTPITFPLVLDRRINYVHAVNVTDRYTRGKKELPAGVVRVMFRAENNTSGDRCAATLQIVDAKGKQVFTGKTNDERFDANDHVTAELKQGEKYRAVFRFGAAVKTVTFQPKENDKVVSIAFGNKRGKR